MKAQELDRVQQAGQRLMIGFDGTQLNDSLRYALDTLKVGGLILFSRNIDSPQQVERLCRDAQRYAATCGQLPLFIAVDQEGGVVARLKPPFTQFAGNPAMHDEQDAIDFAVTTAEELTRVGFNMNMAPVLDVPPPNGPSVMLSRAFGRDPTWVGHLGGLIIQYLQSNGIMAVAKHFPGIGRTVLDSHHDLPDLDVDLPQLEDRDLAPFRQAIAGGVKAVMMSHIRYAGIDPQWPAGLSIPMVRDLLRKRMGFNGLVMTDDLDMGAIAKHFSIPRIVDQCLAATVDILMICHAGPNIAAAHQQIVNRLQHNDDTATVGLASVSRILSAKACFSAA
ncbi:MAG: glycoside hydrolase family 3 protein [Desulfatitalea sp.]|nr:beta-N-acetylhexosaminidase [Desulfatitalea sp.]NNK02104.1 glycoside hydrolase family 3 protein [Desulfatitalea sp.]